MASTEPSKPHQSPSSSDATSSADLAASTQNLSLQDNASSSPGKNQSNAIRPVTVYTLSQLLKLHGSPLVKPPPDMPQLKHWFGTIELEQPPPKKEDSASPQPNPRDRRFRRDNEDGDAPSRPSFRTALSQPSQMGNFKHHSFRGTERDRDREDRDVRDKEGQERLRNASYSQLSDKYDRDRLSHPSTNLRPANGTQSRRTDVRDVLKKKAGDNSDDWRREAPRSGREDAHGRRERDERERARSRARDSSKSRRDPSSSRREDKDRHRRGDRDKDDPKRDRDEHDDSRRWRDDGKRDERMAARKERMAEERDRARDKPPHEPAWEDRKWSSADDRDNRPKRGSARDRRLADDHNGKDRDDRKDREKEKEPAWMDSQAPFSGGMGILSGRAADGELDGIQAWKKGMKEKEQKEKEKEKAQATPNKAQTEVVSVPSADTSSKPLDEIQLFKMMMKREEGKKQAENETDTQNGRTGVPLPGGGSVVSGLNDSMQHNVNPTSSQLSAPDATSVDAPSKNPLDLNSLPSDNTAPPLHTANPLSADGRPSEGQTPAHINPPQGSRFLSLRNASHSSNPTSPSTQHPPQISSQLSNGSHVSSLSQNNLPPHNVNHAGKNPLAAISPKVDVPRAPQGFTPFEDQSRLSYGFEDKIQGMDGSRRQSVQGFGTLDETTQFDTNNRAGFTANNSGSRFAKYFEGKRDGLPVTKGQPAPPPPSASLSSQRLENGTGFGGMMGNANDRAIEDIYAMLNNSNPQLQRMGSMQNLTPAQPNSTLRPNQMLPPNLQQQQQQHLLHQQQQQQQQLINQQQQLFNQNQSHRLDSLYDSRLDDRNFVPDGMVPGLRTAPPPRSRKGDFELVEDHIQYGNQRLLNPQQQRGLDSLYNNSVYQQQQLGLGRSPSHPLHGQFRGGPSPMQNQGPLPGSQQQRLPPGLANLGGRPPHDPSQFVGMPGIPSAGMMHGNGPVQQQAYNNNFGAAVGGGIGYTSNGALRGHSLGQQQLPSGLSPSMNVLPGVGHVSNIDPRLVNHSQMLAGFSGGANLRGSSPGAFGGQQQQIAGHLNGPGFGNRQQPQNQQQLQMATQALSQHMQQQAFAGQSHSQPAHDLMALLMGGGGPRE